MSNRLLRAILALYPRGFRRRYGPEIQDLVNDMEAAGDRSRLRLAGGLLLSAAAERLRAVRVDTRLAIPTLAAVVALGTIVGVTSSPGGRHLPRTVAPALPPTTSSTPPGRVKLRALGGAGIAVSGGVAGSVSAPTFAGSTTPATAGSSTATGGAATSVTPNAWSTGPAPQGTSTPTGTDGTSLAVPSVAGSTTVPATSMSSTGTAPAQ